MNIKRHGIFTKLLVISIIYFFINSFITNAVFAKYYQSSIANSANRAVSLRNLQTQLKWCMRRGNCSNEIKYLGGITQPIGVVIDHKNLDILLIGKSNSNQEKLHTDDLLTIMQNQHHRFAKRKGNTIYIQDIACSIDPIPKSLQKLQKLDARIRIERNSKRKKILQAKWAKLAKSKQKVRIFGIPPSRVAQVIIDADYLLKKLGDKNYRLKTVPSMLDLMYAHAKRKLEKNIHTRINLASMNRFWLVSSNNKISINKSLYLLEHSDVKLRTEEEFLHSSGKRIQGTGRENKFAKQFTNRFNLAYDKEISRRYPIFIELKNLYRLANLAHVIKSEKLFRKAGLNSHYFIKKHKIRLIKVSPTLPGIAHSRKLEVVKKTATSKTTLTMTLTSMGGVDMKVKPVLKRTNSRRLSSTARKILSQRPSQSHRGKPPISWSLKL